MPETLDKETLKALSTDTRQDMLKLLAKRPYTASELSKILDKHVTTITEHLSVLEKSGIVRKKESTNKWVYYTLSDKGAKLFKPYYSWVLMFSLSIVAFVAGIYELTFVSFRATTYKIAEQAAEPQGVQRATAEASSLNLLVGLALLIIAVVLLWIAMRKRKG